MIYHALATALTCFLLLIEPEPPILIPVDAGVADRGSLSTSLRVEQVDFRQDRSFEKLYRVEGSADIYVRKSGGLSAIFRSSEYVETASGDVPIVPAGTVYCIGEIPHSLIQQLGQLQKPLSAPETMIQAKLASTSKPEKTKVVAIESTRRTMKFIQNEVYRRKRLASFVLEIAIAN